MRTGRLRAGVLMLGCALGISMPGPAQQDGPQAAVAAKYPLRLHVLAIDDTYRTQRLQPNWCSGSVPALGGDPGSDAGGGGCGSGGPALTFGDDDGFSGAGRGDLVTLPDGAAQAVNFAYDGCARVRVPPGFTGLQARWKKAGKLEVLIPVDAIVHGDGPAPVRKCTVTATTHEFVYLRLKNGSLVKVSEEAYAKKPALRALLSGGKETLAPRVPTVSVNELKDAPK